MWQLIIFVVLSVLSAPVSAAQIEDAAGRIVTIPDRVERVMAAGPPAAVVLYVLAPEKMIGWPAAPRPNERDLLLPAAMLPSRRASRTRPGYRICCWTAGWSTPPIRCACSARRSA
jgi:hypothetical protein